MSKQFIQLWCEYDYGQDGVIFESEEAAKAWLWEQMIMIDGTLWMRKNLGLYTSHDIFDQGLADFNVITLVEDANHA